MRRGSSSYYIAKQLIKIYSCFFLLFLKIFIHADFRSETSKAAAVRLGWSTDYWSGPDIEAERLFDYSILAPPPQRYPVDVLTCADVRIAGGGSPEVYGLLSASDQVRGTGKQLTVVPEAFPWASGSSEVECQEHWSQWSDSEDAGQYRRQVPNTNRTCSVGCTAAGVQTLIKSTGMIDQYNQALIQSSYGALALSPKIRVLAQVEIAKDYVDTSSTSIYSYYDTPARLAVEKESAPGSYNYPWMRLTLAPQAFHKIPKNRAWSSGITSGGATITKCFASMYYAVHETGHRLGFRHGQLWKLRAGHAVPADPLGPGEFVKDESYGQRLDIMSCCKSDFGLFHRAVAGWLKGSRRVVFGQAELEQASVQKLIVWPFDRSESKGKLLSIAVRRSADEVLLIGFRSASHWQENLGKDNNSQTGPGGDVNLAEDARLNIRGVQVEFIRRNPDTDNDWTERGVLDFNVLHGDWPHALPAGPGEVARNTQFSLLKEGHSWYDPGSQLLLSLERIGECDGEAALRPYNHSVLDFYGFRGEWPGTEAFVQGDYAGYAALECAHLTLSTLASPPTGRLPIKLTYEEEATEENPIVQNTNGSMPDQQREEVCKFVEDGDKICTTATASRSSFDPGNSRIDSTIGQKGKVLYVPSLQPQSIDLTITWPEGSTITAVVWKDCWNRTIATPLGSFQLENRSNTSVSVLPDLLPVSVHVLAADGRHARAEFSMASTSDKNSNSDGGVESIITPSSETIIQDQAVLDNINCAVQVQYRFYEPTTVTQEGEVLGTLTQCVQKMKSRSALSKQRQMSLVKFIFIIVGSIVGFLILFGVLLLWVVRRYWRRHMGSHVGDGQSTRRRRTTTPAALAKAAAENKQSSFAKLSVPK